MSQATAAPVAAIPFTSAAHEYVELAFTRTVTPTANTQQLDPIDIPAYGYLRSVLIECVGSGGVAGAGVISADYPWNLFQTLNLQDVNGGNLYGPIDGYAAYISNLVGGYSARPNMADSLLASLTSMVSPSFFIRVPVEITRKNALGSLPNQSSSSNYKLAMTINTIAAMFSTAPTTPPTFLIRGWMEAWTIPSATDAYGNPQAQVPPLVGTGQYWTNRTQAGIIAGSNTVEMKRLGNYIRGLTFIARNAAGARVDTVFPDPFTLTWDGIQLTRQSQNYNRQNFYEKTSLSLTPANALPAGVFYLPYNHGGDGEGLIGNEDADLWLPTTQSTRLYIDGTSAVAGTIQTLTNDVSSVEPNAASRYVTPNATGKLLAPAQ